MQPPSLQKSQPDVPALTGLRFFAAFFILFAHAVDWSAQFQNSNFAEHFTFISMYGMPLFFVLSGFVIHYNYRRLFETKPFLRAVTEFGAARFARLFPLYFCFLLMAIVADDLLLKLYHAPILLIKVLLSYVTLTHSWLYLVIEGKSIFNFLFGLSWSISTEMFFYAAYIPAVFVLLTIRRPSLAFIAAISYAIVVTLVFIASRYEVGAILSFAQRHVRSYVAIEQGFDQSFYRWLFYFSPYVRVFEFFMGCLAAHAFTLVRGRSVTSFEHHCGIAALILAIAALIFFGLLYRGAIIIQSVNQYVMHLALNFLCAPALAVILFCVSRHDTPFTRFMSLPALVALGNTSYSIYLVHTWTLRIFNHVPPPFTLAWGIEALVRVVIGIAFTLMVAYATYHLIEVPSRSWLRRIFAGWIAANFQDCTALTRPANAAREVPSKGMP